MLFQFQWGFKKAAAASTSSSNGLPRSAPDLQRPPRTVPKREDPRPQAAYGYLLVPRARATISCCSTKTGQEVARFSSRVSARPGPVHRGLLPRRRRRRARRGRRCRSSPSGQRASEVAREWFAADRYQDYLCLHGLAVESAEALAEYVHSDPRRARLRSDDAREMRQLFKQGYRGSRFSFGYPACPNLEDQAILLDLLGASKIGITMGDESQLWPEQSTGAIVSTIRRRATSTSEGESNVAERADCRRRERRRRDQCWPSQRLLPVRLTLRAWLRRLGPRGCGGAAERNATWRPRRRSLIRVMVMATVMTKTRLDAPVSKHG